jgi:hypothetical protein
MERDKDQLIGNRGAGQVGDRSTYLAHLRDFGVSGNGERVGGMGGEDDGGGDVFGVGGRDRP